MAHKNKKPIEQFPGLLLALTKANVPLENMLQDATSVECPSIDIEIAAPDEGVGAATKKPRWVKAK